MFDVFRLKETTDKASIEIVKDLKITKGKMYTWKTNHQEKERMIKQMSVNK